MADTKKTKTAAAAKTESAETPAPAPEVTPVASTGPVGASAEAPAVAAPVETPAAPAAIETPAAEAKAPKAKKATKKEAGATATEEKKPDNLSLDPNSMLEPIKIIKAKGSKNVHTGIAHVLASFNNTIV